MSFYYKPQTYNGRWMPVSWDGPIPEQKAITNDDIRALASKYNIPYANLKAVIDVECAGSGFLTKEPAPARPVILYEAHLFYKNTPLPVSKTRPDLSSKTWKRSLYVGGSGEWDRLRDAASFDEEAALKSASYGLGQVLGQNFLATGCKTVQQFVVEEFVGEKEQLIHMLNFIDNSGIISDLRASNWAGFARRYNGPGYKLNAYDQKLRTAAAKYK